MRTLPRRGIPPPLPPKMSPEEENELASYDRGRKEGSVKKEVVSRSERACGSSTAGESVQRARSGGDWERAQRTWIVWNAVLGS